MMLDARRKFYFSRPERPFYPDSSVRLSNLQQYETHTYSAFVSNTYNITQSCQCEMCESFISQLDSRTQTLPTSSHEPWESYTVSFYYNDVEWLFNARLPVYSIHEVMATLEAGHDSLMASPIWIHLCRKITSIVKDKVQRQVILANLLKFCDQFFFI